jgi:hypothetical protein
MVTISPKAANQANVCTEYREKQRQQIEQTDPDRGDDDH